MKFSIYQESRLGQRALNQDRTAYCYSRDALLMIVADGMGGIPNGDMAAQVATQTFVQRFQRMAQPVLDDPQHFLVQTMRMAHYNIVEQARAKQFSPIPCTTIVVCLVQHGTAYWAHAGDSRLYLLRRRRIARRTHDHSRVQQLLSRGLITPEEAAVHPDRNRVLCCLGGPLLPNPEFSKPHPLRDNDRLLLCSDGLWGPLGNARILTLLGDTQKDLNSIVPDMLTQAEVRGGKTCDNVSLVAMHWRDENTATLEEHTILTQNMGSSYFTAMHGDTGMRQGELIHFTDDEIERTIAEINQSIRKFNK